VGKAPVKKMIQKGSKQKKQAVALTTSSAATSTTGDSHHPWALGDQVMYAYGDVAKYALMIAPVALTIGMSPPAPIATRHAGQILSRYRDQLRTMNGIA
jgi:hypothetical protein